MKDLEIEYVEISFSGMYPEKVSLEILKTREIQKRLKYRSG
jgi:hypothetical protein